MSGVIEATALAIQAPFGAGPSHRHLNMGTQEQQFCFLCFSDSSHPLFSRRKRGSHRTAMPMQDTEVLSICVLGAKGKKKKNIKEPGADSYCFLRLAPSHKATKAS